VYSPSMSKETLIGIGGSIVVIAFAATPIGQLVFGAVLAIMTLMVIGALIVRGIQSL
jgi:hypothetical protein